jgi:adenine/guanine phosphoribosyltransferase-like PRPP-binding protein
VRFLVLDHHFGQDIDALRRAAGDSVQLDVMPYELLRCETLRVLPAAVASGVEAFAAPELEQARRRCAAIVREILEDRFARAPFDALVVPSDSFFYVRAAPAVAHALGVPFLVAQKETTISEHTMREHAATLREHAPPLADLMTVCSERHKRFWVRAGAERERVLVTGQPRFDYYEQPWLWRHASRPADRADPTALFLSYAADAYHPGEGRGEPAWARLRRQTEDGLGELARDGWRVLVKPHPQQPLDFTREWQERHGEAFERRLTLVDPQADVRPLIAAADVVVGFQSTAMLEAMLAGRPVLYTGWDAAAAELGDDLIPFERWSSEITVVRRAQELPAAVRAARRDRCSAATLARRREIVERYLGPVDGHAAERTVAALRLEAQAWAARIGDRERELRAVLTRRRRPLRLARRSRAFTRIARRRLGALLGR